MLSFFTWRGVAEEELAFNPFFLADDVGTCFHNPLA